MRRTGLALVALNVALIATFLVMRFTWFDGSIGCDDEGVPETAVCYRRSDIIGWVGWAELAVMAVTLLFALGLLGVEASRRLRGPERRSGSTPA